MPKFRKKPVVIEAVQYRADFAGECNSPGVCHGYLYDDCSVPRTEQWEGVLGKMAPAHLHTTHKGQVVLLEDRDWIIPEPDGKYFYPCKPDIFDATYEPVD